MEKALEGHKSAGRPALLSCRNGPGARTPRKGDPPAPRLGPHRPHPTAWENGTPRAALLAPGESLEATGLRRRGLWWPRRAGVWQFSSGSHPSKRDSLAQSVLHLFTCEL